MTNEMLGQEAIPKGSQLRISKDHEVLYLSFDLCGILSSSICISSDVYPSTIRGINNKANPTLFSWDMVKSNSVI